MFFDRFKKLCDDRNISVYRACTDIGLNRSAVAKWKNGGKPNGTTAAKLADYFGVTTDYLLGTEAEKAPTLSKKDERDIARTMELLMNQLTDDETLMFDGDPMSDEARATIFSAMQLGLEAAKIKNKERFTPKKFKKG